jgi:hypothetical protein
MMFINKFYQSFLHTFIDINISTNGKSLSFCDESSERPRELTAIQTKTFFWIHIWSLQVFPKRNERNNYHCRSHQFHWEWNNFHHLQWFLLKMTAQRPLFNLLKRIFYLIFWLSSLFWASIHFRFITSYEFK